MHAVGEPLGIGFFALGLSPKWTLAETPVMPKSRYRIMARYMPKVGTRGLDMMFRTSTVQANLDFADEADMVAKLRVGLALQPTITALFANSPFTEGALNGFLSARSEIWRHTDAARTGMLPSPSSRAWASSATSITRSTCRCISSSAARSITTSPARASAICSMAGSPRCRANARPISDWANHLSTIFPEVRLKRYLEMRGADVGSPERILALAAFCFGLFYDKDALAAAGELARGWTAGDLQRLRDDVPRLGLKARIGGRPLRRGRARGGRDRPRRARRAERGATPPDATRPSISRRWSASPPKGAPRPKSGSTASTAPGGGSVDPVFREAAI